MQNGNVVPIDPDSDYTAVTPGGPGVPSVAVTVHPGSADPEPSRTDADKIVRRVNDSIEKAMKPMHEAAIAARAV